MGESVGGGMGIRGAKGAWHGFLAEAGLRPSTWCGGRGVRHTSSGLTPAPSQLFQAQPSAGRRHVGNPRRQSSRTAQPSLGLYSRKATSVTPSSPGPTKAFCKREVEKLYQNPL